MGSVLIYGAECQLCACNAGVLRARIGVCLLGVSRLVVDFEQVFVDFESDFRAAFGREEAEIHGVRFGFHFSLP